MADTFQMEPQAHTEWCWAAVGASINRYFFPDSTLQQCGLATELLPGQPDCCAKRLPPGANEPLPLQNVLSCLGALNGTAQSGALPFKEIQAQINTSFPVCARMGWFGSEVRGHFLTVWGFSVSKTGEPWVDIADPFFGYSMITYTDLVHSYQQEWEWTDTFLLKEPPLKGTPCI